VLQRRLPWRQRLRLLLGRTAQDQPVLPSSAEQRSRLEETVVESEALRGNRLGDPHVRPLWVYVPPGAHEAGRRFPSVYVLQGFTGRLDMWRGRLPFRSTYPELVEELFGSGGAPPCVVVFVDCWTSLGGSQFVDSPATGRYHTYLCEEVVPFVDARFPTLPAREHRGIQGKSSGGYGAALTALLRPDLFGGFASHAGGGLFEVSIRPFFPRAVRALRDRYAGSFDVFFERLREGPALAHPDDVHLLLQYAFSAAYAADDDGKVHLPYDLCTGRLVPDAWERWLEWDTVLMIGRRAEALRSLRAIYLDAGMRDEWYLDLVAEAFRREAEQVGVTDVRLELFDATHQAIEYRYPIGLRYLAERLSP
jgi:hypothetical protein